MVALVKDENGGNAYEETYYLKKILKIFGVAHSVISLNYDFENNDLFDKYIPINSHTWSKLLTDTGVCNIYPPHQLKSFYKYIPVLEGKKGYKKDHNYRLMTVISDDVLPHLDKIVSDMEQPKSIIFVDTKEDISNELSKNKMSHIVYNKAWNQETPFQDRRKKYFGATIGLSYEKNYYYYDMCRNGNYVYSDMGEFKLDDRKKDEIANLCQNKDFLRTKLREQEYNLDFDKLKSEIKSNMEQYIAPLKNK